MTNSPVFSLEMLLHNIYNPFNDCLTIIFWLNTLETVVVLSLSCVQFFATPWTIAYQAPPSMGFSRQEYWSGLPFPSPGDLPNPGIEPGSPALEADALTSEPPGKPLRSRPTLCDTVNHSPPGSFVHGILLARILEWTSMPHSRASSLPRDQTHVSCIAGRFF